MAQATAPILNSTTRALRLTPLEVCLLRRRLDVMNSRRSVEQIARPSAKMPSQHIASEDRVRGSLRCVISVSAMSVVGQKHELPRRSIAVHFAPNKQTPTRRVRCDAKCQKRNNALQQNRRKV